MTYIFPLQHDLHIHTASGIFSLKLEYMQVKSLARGFVWWPGIDGDLEAEVKCVRKITKLLQKQSYIHGSGQMDTLTY